ncbi:MAG: DUF192 domain-containing protein, partial [Planctomycetota bacterium]
SRGDVLTGGDTDGRTGDERPAPDEPFNPLLAMTDTTKVRINGDPFTIALALDDPTRLKGLGDVPDIPVDRGMLFVFPRDQHMGFVMRDCLVNIDIAYLTAEGRVGRMHTMTVDPRQAGEGDFAYDLRLTKYRSGFPARMALELREGTLERLGVSIGDTIEIEGLEELKERAQ